MALNLIDLFIIPNLTTQSLSKNTLDTVSLKNSLLAGLPVQIGIFISTFYLAFVQYQRRENSQWAVQR